MQDHSPDHELVARARDGDSRAFRQLVERYETTVAGVVIRMLGPGDEADDVGQETFLRFYRSLDRFRGEASLKTYLTRIAMNLSLNALKRRRRLRDRMVPWSTSEVERAVAVQGHDPAVAADRTERIEAALQTLDEKHRAVVVLRVLEGYSTRETAGALDIPEGTVLSRLSRALKKLAPHLEPLRQG